MKKDFQSFNKAYYWFSKNWNFEQDRDVSILFSCGLVAKLDRDDVNPDNCEIVRAQLQIALDGLTFVHEFSTNEKVKNLALLKKPIKVNNINVVIDPLKLFNRLILVSERETTVEESLSNFYLNSHN